MLHEILLSLSGQPSPLFVSHAEDGAVSQDAFPLSPPEKALLSPLGRLSRLHVMLRSQASEISSSHPSVICRAVSTAITTVHLSGFQKKILEVERAILSEDSGYVGGYGIVPLSTIVGEFTPWTRRMEWLWEIVRFILPERKTETPNASCSGAMLIGRLRSELRTGYRDLEQIASQLLQAAEVAWMKQLSTWLLYGNLPLFGKDDFFVQERTSSRDNEVTQYHIEAELLPNFVSSGTAASILFIGKSLNHVRGRSNTPAKRAPRGTNASPVTLHKEHIEQLSSLKYPLSRSALSGAVNAIRQSLSQTTLSKLLPLPKILEILSILHDFALLGRGEFAMALVAHADARMSGKHVRAGDPHRSTPRGMLQNLVIKEGDVMAVLAQTWSELQSLQNGEDPVDDELDLARAIIRLSVAGKKDDSISASSSDNFDPSALSDLSSVTFDDLLFPVSTTLSLELQAPLDLFLSPSDIAVYSKIHAYLLGIRRAQIRLSNLWKHTFLRRNHPAPWGPPRSNTVFGQGRLRMSRLRDNARVSQMRPVWATSCAAIFVLSEIGSFFQGEVVNNSWQRLRGWITGGSSRETGTPAGGSRPSTSYSSKTVQDAGNSTGEASSVDRRVSGQSPQHDPETLTVAHRRHLYALVHALFLTETHFTSALRSLLTRIDRFIALVIRLETAQKNMDLETDEGVVDPLADYLREEGEIWNELRASRLEVEEGMKAVIARLRDIDDNRSGDGRAMSVPAKGSDIHGSDWPQKGVDVNSNDICSYIPCRAPGVDRLLMKLDFGSTDNDLGLDAGADSD